MYRAKCGRTRLLVKHEGVDLFTELLDNSINGYCLATNLHPIASDEDVLWCCAHLARVQRQRECKVVHCTIEIIRRIKHNAVNAGLLCEDDLAVLRSFALDNSSEVWTARVINDADCRVTYKVKCDRCINGVDGELHDVWIESKLRKHFTDARNYNGDRIHRPWVWLHNHGIPRDKSSEHSWRCVPDRER